MSGNLSPLRNSSGVNFETGCSCSSSTKNKSESSRSASNMSRKTLSRRAVSNFHRCWNRKSLSRAQLVRYSGDFYCFVPKVYSVVLAVCWPPHLLGVCVCVCSFAECLYLVQGRDPLSCSVVLHHALQAIYEVTVRILHFFRCHGVGAVAV